MITPIIVPMRVAVSAVSIPMSAAVDQVNLPMSIGVAITTVEADPYDGPYEVTPSFSEQTLATNQKFMLNNVIVYEIPVTRTSNPQGGLTVIIG